MSLPRPRGRKMRSREHKIRSTDRIWPNEIHPLARWLTVGSNNITATLLFTFFSTVIWTWSRNHWRITTVAITINYDERKLERDHKMCWMLTGIQRPQKFMVPTFTLHIVLKSSCYATGWGDYNNVPSMSRNNSGKFTNNCSHLPGKGENCI